MVTPDLHALFTNGAFNPMALYGLTGIPFLESFINYLKAQWGLPKSLSALTALVLGVLLNVWVGFVLHIDMASAALCGLVVGSLTSAWYEVTKMPPMPPVESK